MILCARCHVTIEIAYNELCYDCYKEIGRLSKDKKLRDESHIRN